MSVAPLTIEIRGNSTVPIGSAWTTGFNETRPSNRAVGSPRRSAVHACAISCTVNENRRTIKLMKMLAKSRYCKSERLRPTREKRKDGIRRFRANSGRELLARRAPHTREASEFREQRLAAPRADAGNIVERRTKIPHRTRTTMEGDRKPVCFVA